MVAEFGGATGCPSGRTERSDNSHPSSSRRLQRRASRRPLSFSPAPTTSFQEDPQSAVTKTSAQANQRPCGTNPPGASPYSASTSSSAFRSLAATSAGPRRKVWGWKKTNEVSSAAHSLIALGRWRTGYGGRGNAGPLRATYDSSVAGHREPFSLSTVPSADDYRGDCGGHRLGPEPRGKRSLGSLPTCFRSRRRRDTGGPRFDIPPLPDRIRLRLPRSIHAKEYRRRLRRGRPPARRGLWDGIIPRGHDVDRGLRHAVHDRLVRRCHVHGDERGHHGGRPPRVLLPQ